MSWNNITDIDWFNLANEDEDLYQESETDKTLEFLANDDLEPSINMPTTSIQEPNSTWDKFKGGLKNTFENPNVIQALAQLGMGLDPKGFGGAAGKAAYMWSQNEAYQKAQAKTGQKKETAYQNLLRQLSGLPVTDKEDGLPEKIIQMPDGKKIITFSPDNLDSATGTMTTSAKTPLRQEEDYSFMSNPALEEMESMTVMPPELLEAQMRQTPGVPMTSKTNIPSTALSAEDLRGLSPQQIKMLVADSGQDKIYETLIEQNMAKQKGQQAMQLETFKQMGRQELEKLKARLTGKKDPTFQEQISLMNAKIALQQYELGEKRFSYTKEKDTAKVEREAKVDKGLMDQEHTESFTSDSVSDKAAQNTARANNAESENRFYYVTGLGSMKKNERKILTIPKGLVDQGITPAIIQDKVDQGIPVKDILKWIKKKEKGL